MTRRPRASLLVLVALAGTAVVLAMPPRASAAPEVQIRPARGVVEVTTDRYRWELSTTAFTVLQAGLVDGQPRLGGGGASVELRGAALRFGPPAEVKHGADWVELRGWVDQSKALWYVAWYQFFPGQPFVRLVVTLTDRHDRTPAPGQDDAYWKSRVISRWRLEIGAPGGRAASVTQHSSYSYSTPGGPWADVVGVTGAPYHWTAPVPQPDPLRFQLLHATKDGANHVVWHPMHDGRAELTALYTGFSGATAYRAAKAVTYEIVDALGQTHSKTVDQGEQGAGARLGTFVLGKTSVVRLRATGRGGEELALAGPLRVAPASGERPFEVRLGARHDGVLADGPVTLAVKDFWQHHPISLFRTDRAIGWEAIRSPELLAGGMGLTLEAVISMDGPARAATTALQAPPKRTLPAWVDPIDGSLRGGAAGARYDGLLKTFAERFPGDLERLDSFGWRNWGDYQIGVSYSTDAGPVEDWANLQYDLPYGLLLAWLRTGDPALWRAAQASVRHLMDIDLVKFSPFQEKLNGLVYRKGETPKARSHVAAPPIVDQGFAFRSLLLYHALTGEPWALDLARQNIERLVYYARTRPHFVLAGDRPTAWMLRAALAGAQHFPDDRTHDYAATADAIARQLVTYYRANGRLPGAQPVWQAQMVEGLALYHQRTGRAEVAEAVVGHARHLLTNALRRRSDGAYEFMYCFTPTEKWCPAVEWTSEENYAFLWLGSIAAAHRLTRDPFFARWADTLFVYGESRLRERQDTRSWTSALGFPHLYLELSPLR